MFPLFVLLPIALTSLETFATVLSFFVSSFGFVLFAVRKTRLHVAVGFVRNS